MVKSKGEVFRRKCWGGGRRIISNRGNCLDWKCLGKGDWGSDMGNVAGSEGEGLSLHRPFPNNKDVSTPPP